MVKEIRERGYETLVVDDGSIDDSAALALAAGAEVVRHTFNLGQGAALQTGFDCALKGNWNSVITFDSDGQHSVEDALMMVEIFERGQCEVILGSRFLGDAKNIKLGRLLILKLGVIFTRVTTGLNVSDTHNGLRMLSRRAVKEIRLRQSGMAHASEILHSIKKNGLSWCECPVTISYSRESLRSGQRSISGALQVVWDLLTKGRS